MYYEETYNIRMELLELIANIPEEKLHKKKPDNKWTIGQNVEHLYLAESKIVAGLQNAVHKQKKVEEIELNLAKILANRTNKMEAPDELVPTEEAFSKEKLIKMLNNSRDMLNAFIIEVDDNALHNFGFKHRWIGYLSIQQWVKLIGFHEQRHMEQIREVLAIK
ncbi:DinB family protein [Sutcliffiella rhizosphaerae]|uniref:DinB-like domain-containing protein n=1 Tax=Sutcliffiella rhizosphaerae TaxID=2880967 RepID=A0ABM8YH83_9BACI|nr:DinB family protein [Sutcliffiella rhizosphaerae]CAG9619247.1 hypothetical protein BACCIP111883_00014 [Sutcliffiella rhizosphaerae]